MPEITSSVRHVQEIEILLLPGDSHYHEFPKLTYVIEKLERSLLARTDNGYAYFAWPETNEDFIHLLSRVDKEYLLSKISNKSVFKTDLTITRLKRLRPELSDELDNMKNLTLAYPFTEVYLSLPNTHSDDLEAFVWDYPESHKAIADVFIEHVQPLLRKQL